MASILESELAETLADALIEAGLPYDVAITREGPIDPINGGDPTIITYDCRGWRDEYDLELVNGGLINQGDVRVFIIRSSLSVTPLASDGLTIDGKAYAIITISIDPAGTAWDIQARA